MSEPRSFPLDLSALAYPMMRSKRAQSNFRYSARLTAPVDPDLLLQSLTDVIPRYPNFGAKIRPSFFWHRFKKNDRPLLVKEDDRPPLTPLRDEDTNGYPFRLAYRGEEIVLEVFHAVTDANVAALFLTDLLARYVELRDKIAPHESDRGLVLEDPFLRHGKKKRLRDISFGDYNGTGALSLGSPKNYLPSPTLLSHAVPIEAIRSAAKAMDATLTEYVAACYLSAILAEQSFPLQKPLCLFLPINLRRFFPSNTLLNFVCFERISLPKGTTALSFGEILERVRTDLRAKLTAEQMQRRVDDVNLCFNLPVLKYLPLFIKSPAFRLGKKLSNKVRQTTILSNVGEITLPPETAQAVKEVKFYLNVNKNAPLNLAILTYGDYCHIDITCDLKETAIPERFFSMLDPQGRK